MAAVHAMSVCVFIDRDHYLDKVLVTCPLAEQVCGSSSCHVRMGFHR